MREKMIREILEEGAGVYSVGMMSKFDRWAREHPALNGERAFVDFYLKEVSSMNSKGASSRLMVIGSGLQEDIFDKYVSSQEG